MVNVCKVSKQLSGRDTEVKLKRSYWIKKRNEKEEGEMVTNRYYTRKRLTVYFNIEVLK